jgi:hypothetical protein
MPLNHNNPSKDTAILLKDTAGFAAGRGKSLIFDQGLKANFRLKHRRKNALSASNGRTSEA